MLKVGITGNLGSGKSTIAAIFRQMGIPVYHADDAAKWLMNNNTFLVDAIKNIFGQEAYYPSGGLNSAFLANTVFNNKKLLNQLNALVHPEVFKHFNNWVSKQHTNVPFVLKEAALLIESKSYLELDKLIVVAADTETLIKRGMQRNGLSRDEVKARLNNQMNQEEKVKQADFIVINDDKTAVLPQVMQIFNQLKNMV